MRERRIAVLCGISIGVLFAAGCADTAPRKRTVLLAKPQYAKPTHKADPTASIHLSTMVFPGVDDQAGVKITLQSSADPYGKPLAPYVPLLSNADLALHVRQPISRTELRAYNVLLGHDRERDLYTHGRVETSAASVITYAGWALLAGDYPVGRSKWVSGTADGTVFIVRVEPSADPEKERHCIYNLNAGKPSNVNVTLTATSETRPLEPGQYIVVTKSMTRLPPSRPIQLTDSFVAEVLRRAREADVDLGGISPQK